MNPLGVVAIILVICFIVFMIKNRNKVREILEEGTYY